MKKYNFLSKRIALLLVILFLNQALFPSLALALTSGPTQPEVIGFQPASTSDMVNLFTGDFHYNIPLCEVGGYPINLSYQADPKMDDEASWVGLGWSLNPGVINRQMRGIPDDFDGEEITKEFNIRPNWTLGVGAGAKLEVFGLFNLPVRGGLFYNNRRGFGLEAGASTSVHISKANTTLGASSSVSFRSGSGVNVQAGVGLSYEVGRLKTGFTQLSNYNSRVGLRDRTLTGAVAYKKPNTDDSYAVGFSYGRLSYVPTTPLPLVNSATQFAGSFGGSMTGVFPGGSVTGYITTQRLAKSKQEQPAFGYLNSDNAQDIPNAVLDYNTNQAFLRENIPDLPIAFGTNDIFNVQGQGMGGQYRAMRNDIGVFRPARHINVSNNLSLGAELGAGNLVHIGGDFTTGFFEDQDLPEDVANASTYSIASGWEKHNDAKDKMVFTDSDHLYESTYFKSTGDKAVTDEDFISRIGGYKAQRIGLKNLNTNILAQDKFEENNQTDKKITADLIRNGEREIRNQVMSYLTVREKKGCLDEEIKDYPFNDSNTATPVFSNCNAMDINTYERDKIDLNQFNTNDDVQIPQNQITEITVTQPDGTRYIYGIPVYNTLQREVSFSVNTPNSDPYGSGVSPEEYGLVNYNPTNASTANNQGSDHFFEATELPPYAHSYLLTAVLPPNFVDKEKDGISDDDIGSAVKFNYSKVDGEYAWRTPVQANMAQYHPGKYTDTGDDKASYIYGEKELWYVHSIESTTMAAVFYTSDRNDGLGVLGEHGGADASMRMKKLDSIRVFSKTELNVNMEDAVPIKTIHFEYNESLCENIPNNAVSGKGKLTLKKVYFTYGNSQRGSLNAYTFNYNDSPDYTFGTGIVNRWGCLQNTHNTTYPSPHEFPFTIQDEAIINQYNGAWNLNSITTPSGGVITVDYERDDYAYVQDKRAGQMFKIKGFSNSTNNSITNVLYDNVTPRKYIVVEPTISVGNTEEMLDLYFEDVESLYFKCSVNLGVGTTPDNEFITGYIEYDKSDVVYNNGLIYIEIEGISVENGETHPISQAAFQTLRLELPQHIYPDQAEGQGLSMAYLNSIISVGRDIQFFIKGFERAAMNNNWAQSVDLSKSWIRLACPGQSGPSGVKKYAKYGGGTRVKQIKLSDEWNFGNSSSEYGQKYTYTTTTEDVDGNLEIISSGVAAYEPLLGGEENLMKNPMPYPEKIKLAPSNYYYTERPVGEALFPAPTVGYSEVKVESIAYPGVTRTGTGFTIHEFYTAKDFPVKVSQTFVEPAKSNENNLLKFFKLSSQNRLALSQGFAIEVNDMHGKPKVTATFDNLGAKLSSAKYLYKYEPEGANGKKRSLDNKVMVINDNNAIREATLGVEVEMWQEMTEDKTETETFGLAANTEGFLAAIFPVVAVIPIPTYQHQLTQVNKSVTTKLIRRCGLLDKVIVEENGSSITTENVLYDESTGNVLLTRTENEYNDPIFNLSYPAHWVEEYEGMGHAYHNIGATFNDLTIDNGVITNTGFQMDNFFFPGDEVIIENELLGDFTNAWVVSVNSNSSDLVFMNKDGLRIASAVTLNARTIKIVRSGRRNQPGAPIAQYQMLESPLNGNQLTFNQNNRMLSAAANTYSDMWQMKCDFQYTPTDKNDSYKLYQLINPYVESVLGNWRVRENYVYRGNQTPVNRVNTTIDSDNTNANIREEGHYATFNNFWNFSGVTGGLAVSNSPEWQMTTENRVVDTRGNVIESADALGIVSSAIMGYDDNLVVAIANNAYSERIAFDNYEDYNYNTDCSTDEERQRLEFYNLSGTTPVRIGVSDDYAHSGKYSGNTTSIVYATPVGSNCAGASLSNSRSSNGDDCELNEVGGTIRNDCCHCLPQVLFNINEAEGPQDFHISIWVATKNSLVNSTKIDGQIKLSVTISDGNNLPTSYDFFPSGPIIEGWQRIEGRFQVEHDEAVEFVLDNHSNNMYFDDFRLHPFRANMKGYVYDPFSLRLMATLDENNYATFYEYDDEGLLVRVKRETDQGIATIQEARTVLKPSSVVE